jgi:hypothetical protein
MSQVVSCKYRVIYGEFQACWPHNKVVPNVKAPMSGDFIRYPDVSLLHCVQGGIGAKRIKPPGAKYSAQCDNLYDKANSPAANARWGIRYGW